MQWRAFDIKVEAVNYSTPQAAGLDAVLQRAAAGPWSESIPQHMSQEDPTREMQDEEGYEVSICEWHALAHMCCGQAKATVLVLCPERLYGILLVQQNNAITDELVVSSQSLAVQGHTGAVLRDQSLRCISGQHCCSCLGLHCA